MVFRPFFWVTCEKRRNCESSLKFSQTVVGGERVKMRRNSANREHVGGERVKKRRKWKTWCLKKAVVGGERVKMRRNSANREHVGGERVKKRRKWKTWCLKKAEHGMLLFWAAVVMDNGIAKEEQKKSQASAVASTLPMAADMGCSIWR
ncbi:hypothetical protein SUGI_0678950 [Cryptomeria japonica]|nr:hypothetical protein SUGI_0678950 [Cryptomeria japonica]